MEDKCNTGGTHYEDKDGNELSEQEYKKLLKKQTTQSGGKNAPAEKTATDQEEIKQ